MRCRSCCLISADFPRIRLPIVWRFTEKFPFRSFPLMCVNPRKSNVSGFPSLKLHQQRKLRRGSSGRFRLRRIRLAPTEGLGWMDESPSVQIGGARRPWYIEIEWPMSWRARL